MGKTVAFTVKMDDDVRKALKAACAENGYKMNKFLERAVKHELERDLLKEEMLVYGNYIKHGKKTLTDFRKFAREIGMDKK